MVDAPTPTFFRNNSASFHNFLLLKWWGVEKKSEGLPTSLFFS
jgi:hypothetical protein